MLLMKLLSPKTLAPSESEWKFLHRIYRAMLTLLLDSYRKKVVFDHVVLGEGGAELLHCVRDEWFEQQLKRFHVTFVPVVKEVSVSATHRLKMGVFSWKDTMTLLYAPKKQEKREKQEKQEKREVTLDGYTQHSGFEENDIF